MNSRSQQSISIVDATPSLLTSARKSASTASQLARSISPGSFNRRMTVLRETPLPLAAQRRLDFTMAGKRFSG